jgi:hypothetical protein
MKLYLRSLLHARTKVTNVLLHNRNSTVRIHDNVSCVLLDLPVCVY